MNGRRTTLNFDDFTSESFEIRNGCNQGDPLSIMLYTFYNAGLLEVAEPKKNELSIGYINDINLLKAAKTFVTANEGLKDMMVWPKGAKEWLRMHSSEFEMDKLQLMSFSRKRKKHLFQP